MKVPDTYIRGNNVKSFAVPDDVQDLVKDEDLKKAEALKAKGRGGGKGKDGKGKGKGKSKGEGAGPGSRAGPPTGERPAKMQRTR